MPFSNFRFINFLFYFSSHGDALQTLHILLMALSIFGTKFLFLPLNVEFIQLFFKLLIALSAIDHFLPQVHLVYSNILNQLSNSISWIYEKTKFQRTNFKQKKAKITLKKESNKWKFTTHQHPKLRNYVRPQLKKIINTKGSYLKTHHKSISLSQLSTKVMSSVGNNKYSTCKQNKSSHSHETLSKTKNNLCDNNSKSRNDSTH